MDKIAVRVSAATSFFSELTSEAARLDRSPSWLLGHCLGTTLPKLSSIVVAAPRPLERSARPKTWTFFVPRELLESCSRLAVRLGMSVDDVVAFAWQSGKGAVHALPAS